MPLLEKKRALPKVLPDNFKIQLECIHGIEIKRELRLQHTKSSTASDLIICCHHQSTGDFFWLINNL